MVLKEDQLNAGYRALPGGENRIPPLEQGDRLSRAEFERRYNAMPDHLRAELIDGVAHLSSPIRLKYHGKQHSRIVNWHDTYAGFTPGVGTGVSTTLRLDLDNEPQPDSCLFIESRGQAHIDAEGYVGGAPEHLVEVSSSTVSIDLHQKLKVYHRNGVREYLVWRVLDEAVDWFVLRGSDFEPLLPIDGILKSEVFPGLWLDLAALLAFDLPKLMAVLQQGLATPEHAAFVEQLQKRRS